MTSSAPPRTRSTIAIVTLAFLVVVGVTYAAAFLFVPDKDNRGLIFWALTTFLVFVELMAYSFVLSLLAARTRQTKVSTPMVLVSWRILAVYALAGLSSIIIYHMIRRGGHEHDKAFAAVLMIESALALLAMMLVRSWDLYFQANEAPMLAQREADRVTALTLRPLLERLRALRPADSGVVVRLDRLAKRLETVEGQLAHSHGGGLGSREAGATHPAGAGAHEKLTQCLTALEPVVAALEGGADPAGELGKAETIATQLQGCIAALDLG
jgi:hypothetical protein